MRLLLVNAGMSQTPPGTGSGQRCGRKGKRGRQRVDMCFAHIGCCLDQRASGCGAKTSSLAPGGRGGQDMRFRLGRRAFLVGLSATVLTSLTALPAAAKYLGTNGQIAFSHYDDTG